MNYVSLISESRSFTISNCYLWYLLASNVYHFIKWSNDKHCNAYRNDVQYNNIVCFSDMILIKDNPSNETESVESRCTMDTCIILYSIWLYPTTEHDHSFFRLISKLEPWRHLSDHRCILARSRVAIVNLLATLRGWRCPPGIANDATAVWPGVKGLREQCSRYIKIMFSALALGGRSWLCPGFNCAAWPTQRQLQNSTESSIARQSTGATMRMDDKSTVREWRRGRRTLHSVRVSFDISVASILQFAANSVASIRLRPKPQPTLILCLAGQASRRPSFCVQIIHWANAAHISRRWRCRKVANAPTPRCAALREGTQTSLIELYDWPLPVEAVWGLPAS